MKLAFVVCLMLCSVLLTSAPTPPLWKQIYDLLTTDVQKFTDFIHIIDGSIGATNPGFRKTKKAAQRLNKAIDVLAPIKAAKSRIGLVQFSDDWRTKLEIYLGEKEKVGPNNVAIGPPNGVAFQSGLTRAIGNGIKKSRKEFKTCSAPRAYQVAWLVTNGKRNGAGIAAKPQAQKLKNMGVKVCVMGIGDEINEVALKRLATDDDHYIHFKSFDQYLDKVERAVQEIINP